MKKKKNFSVTEHLLECAFRNYAFIRFSFPLSTRFMSDEVTSL